MMQQVLLFLTLLLGLCWADCDGMMPTVKEQYNFAITVFAFRRRASLRRLLLSLFQANYYGHNVP